MEPRTPDSGLTDLTELDHHRWLALQERSDSGVGVFVYGVRTTGVFCIPVCPSRRPLRKNVEFFETGADAISAGYRACKRCRPMDAGDHDGSTEVVVRLCRYLEDATDERSLDDLASALGWSTRHLNRIFKEATGVTAASYRRAQRGRRARAALRDGETVTGAAFDAGYGSMRAFYEDEGARLGVPPSEFRKGAPATMITYGVTQTDLGLVLVARTTQGLCAVRIGDSERELVAEIAGEYPQAEVTRNDGVLESLLAVASDLAAGRPAAAADLPLDVAGSAFQVAVWQAICTIEPGETATYAELARRVGRPNSHRAVANACGKNPIALVVPCHRVVRSDGSAGGYRWGVERKAQLLEAEAGSAHE